MEKGKQTKRKRGERRGNDVRKMRKGTKENKISGNGAEKAKEEQEKKRKIMYNKSVHKILK